jgi:Cdc6-like AAA superfamily ATPase
MDPREVVIEGIRSTILDRISNSKMPLSNVKDETLLRQRIDDAEVQGVSTSLFVVGPIGSGKRGIINRILEKYTELGRQRGIEGKLIATVRGTTAINDSQALMSIVNQFMYRDPVDKNPNVVMEDFEALLRQRRRDGLPAIIIVENIDEFARRNKQTLIYTLLDLMHKEDMFITLICTSHCFNLGSMLEKRIMSRLNAQFLYVSPANAEDVCKYLGDVLTVSYEEAVQSYYGSTDMVDEMADGNNDDLLLMGKTFIDRYNTSIGELFGVPSQGQSRYYFALY